MCESPTNNSLASWDSGMWSKEREREKKKKRAGRLCARNSFPFLPKTELIPVGYPCVGWLLLLRRRYTHRCLQIWLPPAASDWIQGWDSAPQNTTRKHKMASRTSAILGLLKNTIRSNFRLLLFLFYFLIRACCLLMKKERLFYRQWRRINLVPSTEMKPTDTTACSLSRVLLQSKRETRTILSRQPESSRRKSNITYSTSLVPLTVQLWLYFWFPRHLLTSLGRLGSSSGG